MYIAPLCILCAGCISYICKAQNPTPVNKESVSIKAPLDKNKKKPIIDKDSPITEDIKKQDMEQKPIKNQPEHEKQEEQPALQVDEPIYIEDVKGPSAATPPPNQNVARTNTILIPNVVEASFVHGHTQADVDNNDICLLNQIASIFGSGQPVLMCGHNHRSLGTLSYTTVGTIITINYDWVEYRYQVVESLYCLEDEANDNFIDSNGIGHLERFTGRDILQIYTCYGSNPDGRWFVKAVRI